MTITECLQTIQRRYEFSTDYYHPDSEDFMLRLGLVNDAINIWANENGTQWRELVTSTGGTLNIDGEVEIPDLFMPTGKLQIGKEYYEYVTPEQIQECLHLDKGRLVYTVLGGEGHKVVKAFPNPGAVSFMFPYYKRAITFTSGADTADIEMSDPYFIIHTVVSDLFMDDGDNLRANVESQKANGKIDSMRLSNDSYPAFTDAKQPDYNFFGFGN